MTCDRPRKHHPPSTQDTAADTRSAVISEDRPAAVWNAGAEVKRGQKRKMTDDGHELHDESTDESDSNGDLDSQVISHQSVVIVSK